MDKPSPKPRGPAPDPNAARRGWRPYLERSLVQAIDRARGTLTRADFIRRAIKARLEAS